MVLLDLLGRRVALRVLWELSQTNEPFTFRALQKVAETNPSVLNTRLKELRTAGLVSREPQGYNLSDDGKSLLEVFLPLHVWADKWASQKDHPLGITGSRKATPTWRRKRVRT